MRIFSDVFTGDEMMSDIFKYELAYENAIMKVPSAYKSADKIGEVDIGCGNEFGGGEDQGPADEEPAEKVLDVIYNAGLQPYTMTKKEFMSYLKAYFAKVVKYLEENGKADRVADFKKGATAFTKFIVGKFDEIELYIGKSHSEDDDEVKGGIAISYWEDEGAKGPMIYFFMDGMKEEKC